MKIFLMFLLGLGMAQAGGGATNKLHPFRTNFVSGASLSTSELNKVAALAQLCGIQKIAEISTEVHLTGTTILVAGDEKFEGRSVIFKTLRMFGKDSRRTRAADALSLGEFWTPSAEPIRERRTIVRIGDREMRVELLDGIKPARADKIMDAFAKRRIQFRNETAKSALSEVEVMQSSRIGTSGGKLSITFASSPLTTYLFTLTGDEITVVDIIRMYE